MASSTPRWSRGTSTTVHIKGSDLDTTNISQNDFVPERLPGGAPYDNPMLQWVDPQFRDEMLLEASTPDGSEKWIAFDPLMDANKKTLESKIAIQKAVVRAKLHFNPSKTNVGIVTCGGLCPGLNDVVRAITHACISNYGVRRVYGFRYGFWGLSAKGRHTVLELSRSLVHDVHTHGGTFLGSSRGPQSKEEMIQTLLDLEINVLFCVGGDGTQRGALMIGDEARRRGLDIAVMGVPKTIDNDLSFSHRTFGFETAVEQAVTAIRAAHAEATSVQYGVGIVKVMGRHSGFIAAQASLASELVNMCFIPENPVTLDIVKMLIETRFKFSTHCVICVAEGFGQEWFNVEGQGKDASGNAKLVDIGAYLSKEIGKWLKTHEKFSSGVVKYIDPSYMVRGCAPNASDASFCVHLANLAVHEAMYGTTNSIITFWYSNYVVVPTKLATSLRRVVNTRGLLWKLVREMTVGALPPNVLKEREKHLTENELRAAENKVKAIKSLMSKL
jgi:6-phosphofructokinase 1